MLNFRNITSTFAKFAFVVDGSVVPFALKSSKNLWIFCYGGYLDKF